MRTQTLSLTIAAALASLALGACSRQADTAEGAYVTPASQSEVTATAEPTVPVAAPVAAPVEANPVPMVEYADVTHVKAVSERDPSYATVVASTAVTQDTSTSQQVCHDVVVEERQPERDGLKGGTIAGALIGGALGNQAGKGNGRKLATVAGAIAGGYAGREVDRRHEGGNVVSRTEQQCDMASVPSSRVIGYDVSYRTPNGNTGSKRLESSQSVGSRIQVGSQSHVVGYDVTYQYGGKTQTIRMDRRPGDRLAIVDGEVVTAVASR